MYKMGFRSCHASDWPLASRVQPRVSCAPHASCAVTCDGRPLVQFGEQSLQQYTSVVHCSGSSDFPAIGPGYRHGPDQAYAV